LDGKGQEKVSNGREKGLINQKTAFSFMWHLPRPPGNGMSRPEVKINQERYEERQRGKVKASLKINEGKKSGLFQHAVKKKMYRSVGGGIRTL